MDNQLKLREDLRAPPEVVFPRLVCSHADCPAYMHWTNKVEEEYMHGWKCTNFQTCGASSLHCHWRWSCAHLHDFCQACVVSIGKREKASFKDDLPGGARALVLETEGNPSNSQFSVRAVPSGDVHTDDAQGISDWQIAAVVQHDHETGNNVPDPDFSEARLHSSQEAVERVERAVRMIQEQSDACERHAQIISQLERTQDLLETRLASMAKPGPALPQDAVDHATQMENHADTMGDQIEQGDKRSGAARGVATTAAAKKKSCAADACGEGIRAMLRGGRGGKLCEDAATLPRMAAQQGSAIRRQGAARERCISFEPDAGQDGAPPGLSQLESLAAPLEERGVEDKAFNAAGDTVHANGFEEMDAERELLKSKVQDLEAEREVLKGEVQDLQGDRELLKSKARDLEAERDLLKSKVQDMEDSLSVESWQNDGDVPADEWNSRLREVEEAAKKAVEDAEARFEERLSEVREQVQARTRERDQARSKANELTLELDRAHETADNLRDEVTALKGQNVPAKSLRVQIAAESGPGIDASGPIAKQESRTKKAVKLRQDSFRASTTPTRGTTPIRASVMVSSTPRLAKVASTVSSTRLRPSAATPPQAPPANSTGIPTPKRVSSLVKQRSAKAGSGVGV